MRCVGWLMCCQLVPPSWLTCTLKLPLTVGGVCAVPPATSGMGPIEPPTYTMDGLLLASCTLLPKGRLESNCCHVAPPSALLYSSVPRMIFPSVGLCTGPISQYGVETTS